jgi:hypothetical protein
MAFPVAPTNGQAALVNGITYTYATATNSWTRYSYTRFTASATSPLRASPGDQWYETTTDILYTFYYDGTNYYWIDISSPVLSPVTSLSVSGNGTITGNLTLGQTSNAQATSTTTGALRITGGIGIATGNIFIGGSGGTAITHTGNVLPSANLTFNLGSSTAWYGTIYGKASQAQYADLAEIYRPDSHYDFGTVVVFGGDQEVTVTSVAHDPRVAGVVSENPAYLMNADQEGLPIAFTGRVPCRVQGPVEKGTLLVTSETPGVATALINNKFVPGCVMGKSLSTITDNTIQLIEVAVGRY